MMIRSMTGFGQAGRSACGFRLQADIKTVNHRYAEFMIRIPREWTCYEDAVRKMLQKQIKRGRADVYISIEREEAVKAAPQINWSIADGYMKAAEQLRERYGFRDSLTLRELLNVPDLITFSDFQGEPNSELEQNLLSCVGLAMKQLVAMRETEGDHLYKDVSRRLGSLCDIHKRMRELAPQVAIELRAKLQIRLSDLLEDVADFDEQRFSMEAALMADRSNIDEELTRLQSHFDQFHDTLQAASKQDEPIGRKLDFLLQEMNREANTIGSKANHAGLSADVVQFKAELEKIREQIQNIE